MVEMNGAQVHRHWQPRPVLLCGYQGGQAPRVLARLFWFWVGPVVELRPMVGLISALGENQSPIAWERKRSQAVVEMGLNLRPISTETYIKLREVLIVFVYGLKSLQSLVFCDTILILRKRGAPNNRWNINIFAKVFPVKYLKYTPIYLNLPNGNDFLRPGKAWYS